jgi:hypothetical protein
MASHQSMLCNWCLHEQDLSASGAHRDGGGSALIAPPPDVVNDAIGGLGISPNPRPNCPQLSVDRAEVSGAKLDSISPQSSTNSCPKRNLAASCICKSHDPCADRDAVACTRSAASNLAQSTAAASNPKTQGDHRPRGAAKLNHLRFVANHHPPRLKIKPAGPESIAKRSPNHSKAFDYLLMITAESIPEEEAERKDRRDAKHDPMIESRKAIGGSAAEIGLASRSSDGAKAITSLKKRYSIRSSIDEIGMSDLKYRKKAGVQLTSPIRSNYRRYKLLADVLC